MKVTITINTENAAFEDNPNELADILNKLSNTNRGRDTLHNGGSILDTNGNTVGSVEHSSNNQPRE